MFFPGGRGWAGVSAGEGELVTGSQKVLGARLGALTQAGMYEATEALRICIRGLPWVALMVKNLPAT